ncbi:MAG: signal peptide peptidase SppA [Verrucomicrobiota bacterium]
MKKGTIGCLIAAGVFVVGCFLFLILASVLLNGLGGGEEFVQGPKIAHIDLDGVISSQGTGSIFGGGGESMVDRMKESLKKAREDEEVKAIVIRVNSPGGEVTASDTIYHAVKEANEEKPVVIFMDSMAASGGYYVSCGATEILANETTLTGSIGVIVQTLNYVDLFDKVGLAAESFTSGDFKDTLSGARTMRPEERAYVESLVMQMFDRFATVVSEGRDIPIGKLKQQIADGRVYTGKEALENGLVDANGYLEDAYERARELGDAPDAKVKHMKHEPTLFEAIFMGVRQWGSGGETRVELDISDRLLPRLEPGMMYYLPAHYAP